MKLLVTIPAYNEAKSIIEVVSSVPRKIKGIDAVKVLVYDDGSTDHTALSAEKAGADALSLINTLLGLTINIETRKPRLGGITGGISGPAIKPHGLLRVWQVFKAVNIPIIGLGGISNYKDALEYIIAGATALGIGTANYFNPKATDEILEGINHYLLKNEIKNIYELKGTLKVDDEN